MGLKDLKDATQHFHFVLRLDTSMRLANHILPILYYRPKVLLQGLQLELIPAGMVARQLLRTFMADSATAAGVRTSSHAGDKTKIQVKNADHKRQKKKELK